MPSCADAPTAVEDLYMSFKPNRASAIVVVATIFSIVLSAEGTSASAQILSARTGGIMPQPSPEMQKPAVPMVSRSVVQPLPGTGKQADSEEKQNVSLPEDSLQALVNAQTQPSELSHELNCLADAIYFEAKGESLTGQLAVGRVIVARSKSGRFPNSYCGVVFQRSQFSFVRRQEMPTGARSAKQWKKAVSIAQIAHSGTWASPVEGALYFHASFLHPRWRLTRLGKINNHIFYR